MAPLALRAAPDTIVDARLAAPLVHDSTCTGAPCRPPFEWCCPTARQRWHVERNSGFPLRRARDLPAVTEPGATQAEFLDGLRVGLSRADAAYRAGVDWPVVRAVLRKGHAIVEKRRGVEQSPSAALYRAVRQIEADVAASLIALGMSRSERAPFAAHLYARRFPRPTRGQQ